MSVWRYENNQSWVNLLYRNWPEETQYKHETTWCFLVDQPRRENMFNDALSCERYIPMAIYKQTKEIWLWGIGWIAVTGENRSARTKPITVPLHFIHSVFCLTTGPKPLPKRFLHIVRSRASSVQVVCPLPSLRSYSNFLLILVTSISPFIFPSITCFRRQFLRKMWPIQLNFRFRISCRIFSTTSLIANYNSLDCVLHLL
jgi:hypothetical protein